MITTILKYKEYLKENYPSFRKDTLIDALTKDNKEQFKAFLDNELQSNKEQSERDILNILKWNIDDNLPILIAFEGNEIIGAISYTDSKEIPGYIKIEAIYTSQSNRNNDTGKYLLQAVEDNSGNKKLTANPYTIDAEKFFLKSGFKVDNDIDPNDDNVVIRN